MTGSPPPGGNARTAAGRLTPPQPAVAVDLVALIGGAQARELAYLRATFNPEGQGGWGIVCLPVRSPQPRTMWVALRAGGETVSAFQARHLHKLITASNGARAVLRCEGRDS